MASHPVTIRPARSADTAAIRGIFLESDAFHRAGAPHAFRPPDGPWPPDDYLARYREPDALLLVAVDGDGVAGVLCGRIMETPDMAVFIPRELLFVDSLAVLERVQRRGIGRALMAAAEDWARRQGVTEVELTVWEFNQGARALYRNLGYETVNRRLRKQL